VDAEVSPEHVEWDHKVVVAFDFTTNGNESVAGVGAAVRRQAEELEQTLQDLADDGWELAAEPACSQCVVVLRRRL
jgi:hypothetical protein